jgi:RNA polymerase sigma factor (sigma-70 family)
MNESDQDLVRLYRDDGVEEAITTLVTRYTEPLYKFIVRLVGDRHEADDLTQEAFMKMWKSLGRFDLERPFKTWLFTIARNVAVDYLRKKKPLIFSRLSKSEEDTHFEDTLADEMPLADEHLANKMQVQAVSLALEELSLDERSIILLREQDEFSFDEIATIVGRPMNTVKSRYRRALAKLREALALHQSKL